MIATSDTTDYQNIDESADINKLLKQSGAYLLHGLNNGDSRNVTISITKETE